MLDTNVGYGIGGMTALLLLLMAGLLAVAWLVSVAWVWKDANRRGQPGFIVAVVVALLFWPISWVIWLLVRPPLQATASDTTSPQPGGQPARTGPAVAAVIIILLLLASAGGLGVRELMRKPHLRYWTEGGEAKGFLTVTSKPSGASVEIWMDPVPRQFPRPLAHQDPRHPQGAAVEVWTQKDPETLTFRDGQYRVNATVEGTGPLKIGETPIEKYQLPTVNRFHVEYDYGWLRGKRHQSTYANCVYNIRVTKEGYHPQERNNVTLIGDSTASFHVELVPAP